MKRALKSFIERAIPQQAQDGLWRAYRRWRTRGNRYTCPLCGAHLKMLWPRGLTHPVLKQYDIIGGGYRDQATCPICGSTERERLVRLFIRHRTDLLQRPARLLHVAPEPQLGRILQTAPMLDYLSADLYAEDVMVTMDITDIQYPEASFDAIICNHVLEHVPDDERAMRELHRVLKLGGWAILQVPYSERIAISVEDPAITTPEDRARAFGQEDHVRIYAKADYLARLTRAGFRVAPLHWWEEGAEFGNPDNRYGLMPRETLFVCRK
ncbi:MAG TPA: SAM-dependent methyltransferase [Anaerolineae bacterium]|nr:SAM-dependent methyltransferase [Anaerolineae bacterium]